MKIANIISVENGHASVPMSRLTGASVIWVNPRAAAEDPHHTGADDVAAYKAHLLRQCALIVAPDGAAAEAFGIADRYGGDGIGTNGGSGRAVYINGYHVKGVGRTPLVGVDTDASHASGGAYLEECVRESILAEIVHAEFPHGSVPTLAIIDTGREVVWPTDRGPKREKMCLLVRPMFLRPAHIERAVRFKSGFEYEGASDANRVRATALALQAEAGGVQGLDDLLHGCLVKWAQQIAYSYVGRLCHGGVTSSNVSMDGRLVDFGAMAAVPTLARYWLSSGASPTGEQFKEIEAAAKSLSASMAFIFGDVGRARAWRARALSLINDAYFADVHEGMLANAGFSDAELQVLRASDQYGAIRGVAHGMLLGELSHQYAAFDGMPDHPKTSIHLPRLMQLRDHALALCPGLARDDTGDAYAQGWSASWLLPRRGLERDPIKTVCYDRLDGLGLAGEELGRAATALITEVVSSQSRSRRRPHAFPNRA